MRTVCAVLNAPPERGSLGENLEECAEMSPNSDCYSEEELIACLEGTLPEDSRNAIETHIADCDVCTKIANEIKQYLLRECGSDSEDDAAQQKGRKDGGVSMDSLEPAETVDNLGKLNGYDIIRVLGRGGCGIVFEALDNALHRNVAIKVLSDDLSRQAVSRRRFIREARACASINHPNVVTIHGVEDSRDTPFIVMELIEGETLRDRIRRDPKLDLLDILRISSQVAQGLAAAHAQGIIHRDVKPGNIMLLDFQRVKIADFGLARVVTENVELTSRGVAVGTPAYMSPEQVRGEDLDARSDLFAMGCVMYAMLTGHSPFHGRTALEIAMRIETHHPQRLGELSKGVPEFLDSIVARLLEKDREKRFQSAAEVADVLSRHLTILNQTPTDKFPVALRMSMFEPAGKAKRWRWPIVFGVFAMLIGVAIACGWFYFRPTATNTEPGGANAAVESRPTSSPLVPVRQRKPAVTVARAGGADFTTIRESLRNVAAGGTVTIEDNAEYIETILLTDAAQYAGVRIVSPKHATIRSNAAGPVVTIRSIPRLRWEGLNIQAPQMQHGIEINGECPGLEITDMEIRRVANPERVEATIAGIVLRQGAAGTAEEPLLLRGLILRDTNVGIVIVNSNAEDAPPKHIIIEQCEVDGLSRESSTLLAMLGNMEDVSIHHNIFSNGLQGLSISAENRIMPRRCDVSRNSWHQLHAWFVWAGSAEPPLSIQVHHNLIVDSTQYPPPASFLAAINSLPPVFTGNVVVASSAAVGDRFEHLADVVAEFPLLSQDPGHPDYLKPDFERLKQLNLVPGSAPGRYSASDEP